MKTKTETKKIRKVKKYCSMFMGWGRRFVQSLKWFQIVVLVLLFSMMQLKFVFVSTLEY